MSESTSKTNTLQLTEGIPNDGPALYTDRAVYVANRDQNLAAIKENRRLWDNVEQGHSKEKGLLTKTIAGATAVAAAVTLAGVKMVDNANRLKSAESNHPGVVRIENADGRLGAIKYIPWEMANAAQKHAALIEGGYLQPEP